LNFITILSHQILFKITATLYKPDVVVILPINSFPVPLKDSKIKDCQYDKMALSVSKFWISAWVSVSQWNWVWGGD